MGNINIQMVSKVLGINEVTQEECLKLEEGLKTKRYHFTPDRTVSSKSLQTTNVGEGVEKREPSYTVAGNANWCSHNGNECGGFSEK